MKKILSLLILSVLILACMAPMAMAAESTVVTVETKQVYVSKAGTEVTLAVTSSAPAASYEAYVNVDSALTNVTVTAGSFEVFQPAGGGLYGGATTAGQKPAGSVMFYVTATIPADAEPDDFYSVSVSVVYVSPDNMEDYATSVVDGGIKILCDHNYQSVVTAPDCETAGYTTWTCSICGDSYQDTPTEALGHDMQETAAAVAPSCDTTGKTAVKTCSRCGLTEGGDDVAATGHTPAEAVQENIKDATCTKPGSYDEVVYCSVCGKELSRKTVTGQTLPHNWKDATCTEPKTCKDCGATEGDPAGHKWLDATCTDPEKCSVCGVAKDGSTALGHDWKDADCTHPKTCKVCGETEGKALGHEEEYIDNKDGTHDVYCIRCDTLLADNEKHFDTDKDGKCDGCGAKMPEQPTTKPTEDDKKDDQPKNGDITPYPVYFLMAAMAIVAVAYGLKRKFDI